MKSTRPANPPELSESDMFWLQEVIGFNDLRDNVRTSADYVSAIEHHLDANPDCRLNARNADGNTPLHLVALSHNYAAIEALLLCGADVNEANDLGETPITHSHHCPDYPVGFQFLRHLHKLLYLGQPISKRNHAWKYDVGKIYDERYKSGYLAAFVNDPKLRKKAVDRIKSSGEHAIRRMYDEELRKMRAVRDGEASSLDQLAHVQDCDYVAENRLEELKNWVSGPKFHRDFPLFGCAVKQKYRQAFERVKSRERAQAASYADESARLYARSLRNEEERRMREFVAREDTAVVGLMNDAAAGRRRGPPVDAERDRASAEPSDEEKVEQIRRLLAKVPGLRA